MLNRRINSCRASIACSGFIRLSIFSRRSRSIAARSRTSRLRAFHFAYLPMPMPIASSAEMVQTVMSVEVTRSIRQQNPLPANIAPFDECCSHRFAAGRIRPGVRTCGRSSPQLLLKTCRRPTGPWLEDCSSISFNLLAKDQNRGIKKERSFDVPDTARRVSRCVFVGGFSLLCALALLLPVRRCRKLRRRLRQISRINFRPAK